MLSDIDFLVQETLKIQEKSFSQQESLLAAGVIFRFENKTLSRRLKCVESENLAADLEQLSHLPDQLHFFETESLQDAQAVVNHFNGLIYFKDMGDSLLEMSQQGQSWWLVDEGSKITLSQKFICHNLKHTYELGQIASWQQMSDLLTFFSLQTGALLKISKEKMILSGFASESQFISNLKKAFLNAEFAFSAETLKNEKIYNLLSELCLFRKFQLRLDQILDGDHLLS